MEGKSPHRSEQIFEIIFKVHSKLNSAVWCSYFPKYIIKY